MSNLKDRGTLRGTLQRNSGNYNDLINKPAINGHTLIGNQSGHALGLANEDDIINVEANPLGEATTDLHKILVDGTIYNIPDVVVYGTASGAIASFDDGGNDKPLKSLKVAINPVQDLHGYDAPWPGGAKGNLFVQGEKKTETLNGITITSDGFGRYTVKGTATANGTIYFNCDEYTTPNGSDCTIIFWNDVNSSLSFRFYKDSTEIDSWALNSQNRRYYGFSSLSQKVVNKYGISFSQGATYDVSLSPMFVMGDVVSNPPAFIPYSNICPISGWNEAEIHRADGATPHIIDDTYNITWSEAGEVFGGELDVTSGVIHPYKYYSSYNGETLVGEWISSMDVYAEGTTPTIGAQVVDFGAFDTDITIPISNIKTLLGNNNIWSDTGDIEECVYQRDLNIAINKALSQ